MQFSTYFIVAILYSIISVFGVGFALTSWLDRIRRTEVALPRPDLLFSSCVGMYWTTTVFIGLSMAKVPLSSATVKRVLLIDLGLIVFSLLANNRQLRTRAEAIAQDGITLAISFGCALLGVWAMLRFPHVLDSGQIFWTQQVLNGNLNQPVSAMMGFSALVGMYGALLPTSPVVTTAAAFKPLLLGLYGCLAVLLGTIIAPRHRLALAFSFLALSVLSTFGSYGLLETGKDSMWGLLFAMAFFGTLCRSDAGGRGVELAVYFTMAATLGVIALPYMIVAYGLWLVFSVPEDRPIDTVPAMLVIGAPILPTVLAGFLNAPVGLVYGAYLFLTVVVLLVQRVRGLESFVTFTSRLVRPVRSVIPLIFALAAFLLFPVALVFPVWVNADGSVVTETRAPLDGVTSFLDYMLAYPVQNVTVGFGLFASLVIGFTPPGRRNPGLLALAAMPLVSITFALVRAHLPVHVINDFNIWDLVKDVPQWFGGTLLVFVLLAFIVGLSESTGRTWVFYTGLVTAIGTCGYVSLQRTSISYYTKPVTYKDFAASSSPVMAEAANVAWSKMKGLTLWIDPHLIVSNQYFYSFQMYDARPSIFDPSKIADALNVVGAEIGFLVNDAELVHIKKAVEARDGSIEYLAHFGSENASMMLVHLDGKGNDTLPSSIDQASVIDGHYDREISGRHSFYWMRSNATIAITAPNMTTGCITVSLFDAGLREGSQTVTLTAEGGKASLADVSKHTITAPAVLHQTVQIVDGTAKLRLTNMTGERSFPNDTRQIAYGLMLPITLSDNSCETAVGETASSVKEGTTLKPTATP